jgi:hypothetical protein
MFFSCFRVFSGLVVAGTGDPATSRFQSFTSLILAAGSGSQNGLDYTGVLAACTISSRLTSLAAP